jgi:hypothetical protein
VSAASAICMPGPENSKPLFSLPNVHPAARFPYKHLLFLAARPLTVQQNETERRALHEILAAKDLCRCPDPVTGFGLLANKS